MKSLITLSIVVVLGFVSFGQNSYTGYYGKQNYVEIISLSHVPIFPNLLSGTGYKAVGNSLIRGKRWYNPGVRIAIGRAFKNNLAASFEAGMDFNEIYGNIIPYNATDASLNDPSGNYYYNFERHESVAIRNLRLMPKIEFTTFDGLLPAGLVHQIGLGYRRSTIVDKDYIVEYDENYSNVPANYSPELRNLVDLEQAYHGMQLLYALKLRTPVGKSLFINYGFRYTVDFRLPNGNHTSNQSTIHRVIAKSQFRNFMSFDLGLTMPF